MKKIDKRSVITVVLALMLVLSTVFYVGLRPTTAWFHEEYTVENAYNVGTFEVDLDTYVHRTMNLSFDATTKINEALANDAARNKEFEYAVKYLYITVTNDLEKDRTGNVDYLDALVKLKFDNQAVADGLRYYYFACANAVDPVETSRVYYSQVSTDANGVVAGGDLASRLKTFCSSQSIETDAAFTAAESNPQMYVQTNTTGFANGAIRVPHNKQVTICIALWVDHGASGVTNQNFSTEVTLIAQQAVAA